MTERLEEITELLSKYRQAKEEEDANQGDQGDASNPSPLDTVEDVLHGLEEEEDIDHIRDKLEEYQKSIGMDLDSANRPKKAMSMDAIDEQIERLSREQEQLKTNLDKDYHHSDALFALGLRCINGVVGDTTWELCPFHNVTQRPKNGAFILAGLWKGWSEDRLAMEYADGMICWQGPTRAVHVDLVCSPVNEIVTAFEPSVCRYSMKVGTPAICK